MVWQQLTCRFGLGDMAPAQAARGSFRQGPIEPEAMMIKHEIQTAAREEPLGNYGSSPWAVVTMVA